MIYQAQDLLRVMMAASALHPHAEENLSGRLGEVFDLLVDEEVTDRSVRVEVPLRGQQFASHHIQWLVVAERLLQPTGEAGEPLVAEVAAM